MELKAAHPVRLSVEIDAEIYEAILRLLAERGIPPTLDEIRVEMKRQWRDSFLAAFSEATQKSQEIDVLLRDVEIELRIVQRSADDDIEDDDEMIRTSIKQGLREALSSDVLTEEEFWKAVAADD